MRNNIPGILPAIVVIAPPTSLINRLRTPPRASVIPDESSRGRMLNILFNGAKTTAITRSSSPLADKSVINCHASAKSFTTEKTKALPKPRINPSETKRRDTLFGILSLAEIKSAGRLVRKAIPHAMIKGATIGKRYLNPRYMPSAPSKNISNISLI